MHVKTILALSGVLGILSIIALQYDFFISSANNPFIQTAIVNTNSNYPDGPVWKDRALYYTEYADDRVVCRDGRGNTEFWKEAGCGPRALALLNGALAVACRDSGSLVTLDPSGSVVSRISSDQNGEPFGMPVDMAPDAAGGLYFISINPRWRGKNGAASIYYLDRKRTAIKTGISVRSTGGITVIDGGNGLLVSEMIENRVVRYTVEGPGRLSWSGVFVRLPDVTAPPHGMDRNAGPDALAVDSGGTVFVCHSGASRILLLSRTGTLQQVIKTSLPYVTGIGFGRLDNVAYITAVSSASGPPFNGAVFEFTRKRTRQSAP